jgi:hypothetical protein
MASGHLKRLDFLSLAYYKKVYKSFFSFVSFLLYLNYGTVNR